MNIAQKKRFNKFLESARMRCRALNRIVKGEDEHKCDIPFIDLLEDEYVDDAKEEILRIKLAVSQIYLILTGIQLPEADITSLIEGGYYE